MKYEVYRDVVRIVQDQNRPGDRIVCMNRLRELHPALDVQTLGSIYSQEVLKKVKKSYYKHVNKAETYYQRFLDLSEDPNVGKGEVILFNIAREVDFPPSMLSRMVVEHHLLSIKKKEVENEKGKYEAEKSRDQADQAELDNSYNITVSKQELNKALRNPDVLNNQRLSSEVELCNVLDDDYGPLSDVIKQSIGHEKEVFLKRKAKQLNLVFKDEDQMRAEGFDKTPDIRLEIPVAIDGVVIHWIESKASFGDEGTHNVYLKDQFWSYQNRFGPGIVIYWFGFIEELDVNRSKGILLYDHLPENLITFDPNKM